MGPTAETTGAGRIEVGLDSSITYEVGAEYPSDWKADWLPRLGASIRYGLLENLDAMLRVGPMGGEAGVKWRFLRLPAMTLAINPTVGGAVEQYSNGYDPNPYAFSGFVTLPLLVDLKLGRGFALVLTPKANLWTYSYVDTDCGPWRGTFLSAAGTVGLAIPLLSFLRVMPEVAVGLPVANWQTGIRSDLAAQGRCQTQPGTPPGVLTQAGVAFIIGKWDDR